MLGQRTLLINPPLINGVAFTRQGRCQEREEVLGTTKPPYTLALLASLLRDAGCDVRLVDATAERLDDRRGHRAARSRGLRADADPLSQHHARRSTPTSRRWRRSKQRYGAPMFCFGPHASTTPAESMARAPEVDGMFVGEPEDARAAARRARLARSARRDPEPDLAARTARSCRTAPTAASPASSTRRIRRGTCSRSIGYALPLVNKPYVIVETSRGCPYSCDFCVAPIHQGHKFRERSAKALVDEIERSYRELGVEFFYLWGDTVTLNVKSFTAFCDELIARKLPIQWFGNARADNLTDPAFVHRLKRAGCWMLALGIESESEEMRKDMVKRLERQKIQTAFSNMRDAGIKSFAFFIFGYPGETLADDGPDDRATRSSWIRTSPTSIRPCPIPGTALYEKCVREGLLPTGGLPTGRRWSTRTTCCAATASTSAS